ncbi:MAG: hypothetical protein ACWA47_08055 [Brevirhabdus sp.]
MIVVKLVHILAFCVAVGGGVASMILGIRAARSDDAARLALRGGMKAIGTGSFFAIIVLWLTGLWLWGGVYGFGAALGGLFHAKLAAVVGITVLVSFNFAVPRIGKAVAPKTARALGASTLALAIIAIALALMVFDAG